MTPRAADKAPATTKAAAKKAAAKKVASKTNATSKLPSKRSTARNSPPKRPGINAGIATSEPEQPAAEALPFDFDEVVTRSRAVLAELGEVTEQKMFGGVCFMLNGNMLGGVSGKKGLMIRVGPKSYEDAIAQPFARPMDFTGRRMRGFVFVDAPGYADEDSLGAWLGRGFDHAASLPPKQNKV